MPQSQFRTVLTKTTDANCYCTRLENHTQQHSTEQVYSQTTMLATSSVSIADHTPRDHANYNIPHQQSQTFSKCQHNMVGIVYT